MSPFTDQQHFFDFLALNPEVNDARADVGTEKKRALAEEEHRWIGFQSIPLIEIGAIEQPDPLTQLPADSPSSGAPRGSALSSGVGNRGAKLLWIQRLTRACQSWIREVSKSLCAVAKSLIYFSFCEGKCVTSKRAARGNGARKNGIGFTFFYDPGR